MFTVFFGYVYLAAVAVLAVAVLAVCAYVAGCFSSRRPSGRA